jgi:hypothetical protein
VNNRLEYDADGSRRVSGQFVASDLKTQPAPFFFPFLRAVDILNNETCVNTCVQTTSQGHF